MQCTLANIRSICELVCGSRAAVATCLCNAGVSNIQCGAQTTTSIAPFSVEPTTTSVARELCTADSIERQCQRACIMSIVSVCRCDDGVMFVECASDLTLPEFSSTPSPPAPFTSLVVSSGTWLQAGLLWLCACALAVAFYL
jgi:hypothetical protein